MLANSWLRELLQPEYNSSEIFTNDEIKKFDEKEGMSEVSNSKK